MNQKVLVKLFTPAQIFTNYLKESIKISHKNLIQTFCFTTLFIVILTSIYIALMFPILNLVFDRENQDMILGFGSIPFLSYFISGFIRYYLRLVRDLPVNIKYLFIGHKRFIQIFIILTLYYVLYILLIKITSSIQDFDKIMQIRILLGVVLFFILVSRLIYSPFFVIDADYNARDAMRSSFLLTSGRTAKNFTLLGFSILLILAFLSLSIFLSYLLFQIANLFNVYNIYHIGVPLIILTSAYPLSLIIIAFVLNYDIHLKNKYSKRKEIITKAAIIVKKKLEDSNLISEG